MAHTSSAWKKACAGSKWDTTQRWSEWAGFSHRLTEYYLYVFTIFYFIAQTLSEVGVLKASVACLGNEDCAGPDTATLVLAAEHSDQQAAPSYRRWHHSGLNIKEELNLKSLLPGKKNTLDPIPTSAIPCFTEPLTFKGSRHDLGVQQSPVPLDYFGRESGVSSFPFGQGKGSNMAPVWAGIHSKVCLPAAQNNHCEFCLDRTQN